MPGASEARAVRLRAILWTGNHYHLQIRTGWKSLVRCPVEFSIDAVRISKCLPEAAGYAIMDAHDLVKFHRGNFSSFDAWWAYSKLSCDNFCDYHLMRRPREDSPFKHCATDSRSLHALALEQPGYRGPSDYSEFAKSIFG
jgi:hypothetical protein